MGNSPHAVSIHILDDDSLLNVFNLYRPFSLGEEDDNDAYLLGGKGGWVHGRWWYGLTHVCRRWRTIILGSAFYLGVSLVCTKGTPVADMLENLPSLPLVIDYSLNFGDIIAEAVKGAILALKKRDRVRRVRLDMPATSLRKLIVAMDEEYPILEHLIVIPRIKDTNTILMFRDTFQAPHLSHLTLSGFILPIKSRLLTSAAGLVTLCLQMDPQSNYFYPSTLLRLLSFMPQLEALAITSYFAIPDHELVERQLSHVPITHAGITLPNLRLFKFHGTSASLEVIICRIITPCLEKLCIRFLDQLTFSVPRLLQFIGAMEALSFDSAKFKFSEWTVEVEAYTRGETEIRPFTISIHRSWQVSSMAQIVVSISQMLSVVEHLTLEYEVHTSTFEENEVHRIGWPRLLRSFSNVKTLTVAHGLVDGLSQYLQSEDGELASELLPELQEIAYSGSGNSEDLFTSFIDACRDAGRPLTLVPTVVRHSPNPNRSSSLSLFAAPLTISAASEAGIDLDT